jgi:uncharacterized membrane protein
MMGDDDAAETGKGLERIIAFSDCVIGVAITLLVVDIRLPEMPRTVDSAELAAALVVLQPKITAYVLSFLVVGQFWHGHHVRFRFIQSSDLSLIWLNMLFLMTICFVPFVSSVLSEHPNATAHSLYDGTMALVAVLSAVLWGYAIKGNRLVSPRLDAHARWHGLVSPLLIVATFVLAGVVSQFDVRASRWIWFLLVPAGVRWRRGRD